MEQVALPHLIFLTVLYLAGLAVWLIRLDTKDTLYLVGSVIIAGLGAGIFLGVWT